MNASPRAMPLTPFSAIWLFRANPLTIPAAMTTASRNEIARPSRMGQIQARRRQDRLGAAGRPRHGQAQGRMAGVAHGRRGGAGHAGKDVVLVSSGAVALGRHKLGLAEGPARARAEPGGGRRRPDQPGARLPGAGRQPRTDGGAGAAHARRHGGAQTLSQRAPHDRDAAGAQGHSGRQRERHGGDRRDQVRRQRPPFRARRQHGVGGLPRAAVRHRRALHGAAERKPRRPPHPAGHRDHRRDRGHGRATPAPSFRKAA